jgi:hypothetical protein
VRVLVSVRFPSSDEVAGRARVRLEAGVLGIEGQCGFSWPVVDDSIGVRGDSVG